MENPREKNSDMITSSTEPRGGLKLLIISESGVRFTQVSWLY